MTYAEYQKVHGRRRGVRVALVEGGDGVAGQTEHEDGQEELGDPYAEDWRYLDHLDDT